MSMPSALVIVFLKSCSGCDLIGVRGRSRRPRICIAHELGSKVPDGPAHVGVGPRQSPKLREDDSSRRTSRSEHEQGALSGDSRSAI